MVLVAVDPLPGYLRMDKLWSCNQQLHEMRSATHP